MVVPRDPAGVPTCTLGTLAAGGVAQYTITVDVDPGTKGTLTNTATVFSSTPLINTDDDSVMENTQVKSATLGVSKAPVGPFLAGTLDAYLVTVTATGVSNANDVVVTDVLDPRLTFVPGSSGPNCSAVGQTVTCTVPTITAGGMQAFTIAVMIAP